VSSVVDGDEFVIDVVRLLLESEDQKKESSNKLVKLVDPTVETLLIFLPMTCKRRVASTPSTRRLTDVTSCTPVPNWAYEDDVRNASCHYGKSQLVKLICRKERQVSNRSLSL
jgi:hypothetical protein